MKQLILPLREGEEEPSEVIDLKNMYYCYTTSEFSEDKQTVHLGMVYAAHTEDNGIVVFVQPYQCNTEELQIGDFVTGGFLEAEGYSNDHIFRETMFMLDGIDGTSTDFITAFNKETRRYEFNAYINNTCIRFSIPRNIMMGINIINRCIHGHILNSSCVREANVWMGGRNGERLNAEMNFVERFRILDISKSIKNPGKFYSGVVAIEFLTHTVQNIEKKKVCVMPYFRGKPLRRKNVTKDISLMEVQYANSHTMGSFCGQSISIENETIQLFASDRNKNFIILDMTTDLHNEFSETIQSYV